MNQAPGHVRIIGGTLRGSKLPVATMPGLRPTSDRARETLFNWLQGELAGRRALDLFAGSGALGFEAASRGAAAVTLVERDATLARSLRESAQRLKVETVTVDCAQALSWLARTPDQRFELVFLDPPFQAGLHEAAAGALAPWLAARAWVYVEMAADSHFTAPAGWRLHREGGSRGVRHLLYRAGPEAGADTLGGSSPWTGIQQA